MADLRAGTFTALALALVLGLAAVGCGESSSSAGSGPGYRVAQLKKAYVRARDTPAPDLDYWVNPDFHSHADYVPNGAIEICPLTQRADVPAGSVPVHVVLPKAGESTGQFVVEPRDPDDHVTPKITQAALVFGTDAIAAGGMAKVTSAMAKCPPSYSVQGGPPQILGTYALNSRPVDIDGWTGIAQQVSHSYQASDVFYEDDAHVVLRRRNAILDILLTHEHVVGDRSDAVQLAQDAAKSIVKRLDS